MTWSAIPPADGDAAPHPDSIRRVYLDWNATAPPLPVAVEAVERVSGAFWANPSSVHAEGRAARACLEQSRAVVARCVSADARDLTFTSGGTEANNLLLRSLCAKGATLLTSRLEHPSVVRVAEFLATGGVRVVWLGVEPSGQIDVDSLASELGHASGRVVVALQAVNHETGVIQPIEAASELCKQREATLHVDAVQAVGKGLDIAWDRADTISVAAHKLGGPKGIGAAISRGCGAPEPLLLGGAQEARVRPGTTPVALAAGFAAAADWAMARPSRYAAIRALRDRLEHELVDLGGEVNGSGPRVSHVVNVSFAGVASDEFVAALDMEGVAVSGGSACSSGSVERSPVVEAMLGASRAATAIRASLGDTTTDEDVELAISAFRRVVARARADG